MHTDCDSHFGHAAWDLSDPARGARRWLDNDCDDTDCAPATSTHSDACDLCLCEYDADGDGDADYPPAWGETWAEHDDSDCDDDPPATGGVDDLPF